MILAAVAGFFYIAGMVSAALAAMTARTAQGAIAWTVALITFPFVSVPLYWVFGRSKFQGFEQAYKERADEIDTKVELIRNNLSRSGRRLEVRVPEYEALEQLCNSHFVRGNATELLIDGAATFDSICAGIAEARDYVIAQFYMIHDDGLGRRFADCLAERARAGVRVFLLYDEIGSYGLPPLYVDRLRAAGVRVSGFKTTQGFRNRFQLNFRNHRKIVIVDGIAGWVGGHNVGDEYLGLDPKMSPWRDTHVKLEGPAVIQLQMAAVADWFWATRELPDLCWEARPAEHGNRTAMVIPSAPTQRLEVAGLMFVTLINAAQRRVWITAPYFVPDESVMRALKLAALRGADVRVVLPGQSDNLLVSLAAYHYVEELRELGIRFYEFRPGFLHQKVMLVDDEVGVVGTANFDNRSFRLNFEVTAVVADATFVTEMAMMLEADFARCEVLDPSSLRQRPFFWRLGVRLARLVSPVL
jgi:cardiolipin synthase